MNFNTLSFTICEVYNLFLFRFLSRLMISFFRLFKLCLYSLIRTDFWEFKFLCNVYETSLLLLSSLEDV